MRMILCTLSLLLAACTSAPIVIRAPLDGYVELISEFGTTLPAATSPAKRKFDEVRIQVGMPTVYTAREHAPTGSEILFQITSDLLELQLAQEKTRVNLAKQKLMLAKRSFAFEKSMRQNELAREKAKSDYQWWHVEAERRMQTQKSEYFLTPGYAGTLDTGKVAAEKEYESFVRRQEYQLADDLPQRLNIAQKELTAAEVSVKIIEASIATGKVVCPQKCRAGKSLVMSGQYVTRGDPIVEIEIEK